MVAASISLYYLIPYKTQTEIRPPFRLTLLLKYAFIFPGAIAINTLVRLKTFQCLGRLIFKTKT